MSDYGYVALGKFSSARDEALYTMASDGWANRSSGTSEAPTGWFALVHNDACDLPHLGGVFEAFDGFADVEATWTVAEMVAELTGSFIVTADDHGFVYVETFPSEADAIAAYDDRTETFEVWSVSYEAPKREWHLLTDAVAREVATGHLISDAAAVTIASWWQSPADRGSFAQLAGGGTVNGLTLSDDIDRALGALVVITEDDNLAHASLTALARWNDVQAELH